MAQIYLIPGLGNDRRIFSKLLPLLDEKEVVCLEHIEPLEVNEGIPQYAKRLVDRLPVLEKPPVLIGMSLGGTVATEMAKLMPHRQLVIISSFKHKSEQPFMFKIARILPLYVLVPAWFIRIVLPFFARILGICDAEDSQILKEMLYARSANHFAWGRRAIVNWENEDYPTNFVHINGTKDHIFKNANRNATHLILGGTHNMVLDRAEEIAAIINKELLNC